MAFRLHLIASNARSLVGEVDRLIRAELRKLVTVEELCFKPGSVEGSTFLLATTYSLHCSSFLGLPFRILNTKLV